MKPAAIILLALLVIVALFVALLGATLAEFPWLAAPTGTLETSPSVSLNLPPVEQWPIIVPGQVPAEQAPQIAAAADTSSCGVTAADLTTLVQVQPGLGSLPSIAAQLCALGYASNRGGALDALAGPSIAQQIDAFALGVDVVAQARTWLGVPYLFGGCSRSGVDCSCFTMLVYQALGVHLPRTAQAQYDATPRVAQSDLQPGDLVFFQHTYASADRITHVGIYVGNGQQLNAPDTGQVVSIQPVFSGFWGSHFAGAGRPGR